MNGRPVHGPSPILLLLLCALVLMAASCGKEASGPTAGDIIVDRIERAPADSLYVPPWSVVGESVEVRVMGDAGPNSCYWLERIDVDLEDHTFILSPFRRYVERYGRVCSGTVAEYDTTLVLQPSEAGTWWVRVHAAGDTLVDSTLIVVTEISAATVHSLEVSTGSVLESGIRIRLLGNAGTSPQHRLASVGIEEESHSFTLRLLAGPCGLPGLPCETTTAEFDTTLVLFPAEEGTWTLSVVAGNGTFVRTSEVVASDTSSAWIYTLSMPPVCDLAEGVDVRLTGVVGNQACRGLTEIGIELRDRTYTLHPLTDYLDEFDYPCRTGWVFFDTTLVLYPPEHGPWWIEAIGSNGTFADSIKANL
ncbi:MAG: hypothetical protein KAW17_04695 [Candidatus Eisenbacteria sp.]|nr:hypothetical protein [Candidatus Eisenbacteria bacterium]